MAKVEILDSTLRDGAQAEGISFSVNDKLAMVETLDALGIPLVEAGNPGSNPKDLEFFREAAKLSLKSSRLCAFGSTRRKGIEAKDDPNVASMLTAGTDAVVIFGKSWDFHVTDVIRTSLDENLAMIRDTVAFFRSKGKRVIYDAEHFFDGFKANREYALKTLCAAAEAGADCLALCDTNGGSMLSRIQEGTKAAIAAAGPVAVGIHAHNDSGLAVAVSLEAVALGAAHVQGTFIGFGERCGNANLSTAIPNLQLKMGMECIPAEALRDLTPSSRRIAEIANLGLPDELPYVGRKAFAHKAGMHVDGVLKDSTSFEHVPPDSVGNSRRVLLSEVAGRSSIVDRIKKVEPAVDRDSPVVAELLSKLKELEQEGYQFEGAEGSFDLLVRKALGKYKPLFTLERFRIIGERPANDEGSQAMIKIVVDGQTELTAAEGDGPVNALDRALRKALERFYPSLKSMRLTDFKVRVLDGSDATAAKVRVLIESTDGKDIWTTVGVSTDIIEASWRALVDSVEYKLIREIGSKYGIFA
jgi:2-isopropylmalate synthase